MIVRIIIIVVADAGLPLSRKVENELLSSVLQNFLEVCNA
jgi:hypothetical protein